MSNQKVSAGLIDQSGDFNFTGELKLKGSPIVSSVDSIKNLSVPTVTGQSLSVTGFYAGTTVGGGDFIYDASRDKADHNGGTIIAPEAITAWDGLQSGIATLLEWVGTGVGCWVRLNANSLSIEDFGGGENVTDNTKPLLSLWGQRLNAKELVASAGTYSYLSEITLKGSSSESGIHLNHFGDMVFSSTNGLTLESLHGCEVNIGNIGYISEIVNDALTSNGVGLTVRSCWSTEVDCVGTANFLTGSKLVGGGIALTGNGMAFCGIKIRNAKAPLPGGTAVVVTTETFSGNPGYFNENHLHIGFMRAEKGIEFIKGPSQSDPFNGNKLHYPQIENVSTTGIILDYCTSNTILQPRFEGGGTPSGNWIQENANCSRNDYYITGPVVFSKILLLGKLSNYYGRMNTDSGGTVSNQKFGGDNTSADTNNHDLYLGIKAGADSPNNSVCFGGIPGRARFDQYAGRIKDGLGTFRKFGFLDPYGHISISASTVMPKGISLIQVTSSSSAVAITMNLDREENGYYCYLEVTSFTNPISIAKSSGAITVADGVISATGMYLLAYRSDVWKVTKVGEKFS